jgi:predicted deacetylase
MVISLHDVHPGSLFRVKQQVRELESWGAHHFSLLVVPWFHGEVQAKEDDALADWLREREALGDEIVLHGWKHWREGDYARRGNLFWTRFYTANEAEFLDVDAAWARERLGAGREMLRGMGLSVDGFIAPAWLLGDAAWDEVRAAGFRYTTTVRGVRRSDGSWWRSQSLCWSARAAWRRQVSLFWNWILWRDLARGNLMRVSLHPVDVEYEALWRQIGSLVRGALRLGFVPTTYRQVCATDWSSSR